MIILIPFFFVFSPELLFIGATPLLMIKILFSSLVGMFNVAVGVQGYLFKKLFWPWRLVAITAGLLLIDPGIRTTLIGLGISVLVVFVNWMQNKKDKLQTGLPAPGAALQ